MILSVSEPTWDKSIRKWRIFYKVDDVDIGIYEQEIQAEALISIDRIQKDLLQIMKKQRGSR